VFMKLIEFPEEVSGCHLQKLVERLSLGVESQINLQLTGKILLKFFLE